MIYVKSLLTVYAWIFAALFHLSVVLQTHYRR